MKSIFSSFSFSFLFVIVCVLSVRAQTVDERFLNFLAGGKITGAWQVNYGESDNPLLKMQAMLQNKLLSSNKTDGAANDSTPAMSVSLVPPETLVLADDDQSVTINENFNEIVFTRTIITDGVKRSGELQNGLIFSVAATRANDSLKVETESPRGNRMIETYSVSAEGRKLLVTVRFENEQAKEIFTLRRVYDRTLLDPSPAETENIQ